MKKVLANKKAIALFVVPGLVLYTILVIVPVIWSLYYSLYSGSPGNKMGICRIGQLREVISG